MRRRRRRLLLPLVVVVLIFLLWARNHDSWDDLRFWDRANDAVEQLQQAGSDLAPAPVTPPLSFDGFNPGNIISDQVFYNSSTMDAPAVQAFLEQAGQGCRPGKSSNEAVPCLSSYTEDSPSFPADDFCYEFPGAADDSAASIITKAATACGVNPQVLLVILQKEQGLLTASGAKLNPQRYAIATGYGCPDTANCDPQFFGFANQVYHAARQLRIYANEPWKFAVQPEADNEIPYSPDPDCGASTVYIENYATAGLYNYTPYQPNAQALEGSPNACSAVGNLYFYAYFNAYFG